MNDEEQLGFLAAARNQDDLVRDIGRQADEILTKQSDERDNKRIEKTETNRRRCESQLKLLRQRLSLPIGASARAKARVDITQLEEQLKSLDEELEQIAQRIEERHKEQYGGTEGDTQLPLSNESRRDFLIRTGKITPFSKMAQVPRMSSNLQDVMLDAEVEQADLEKEKAAVDTDGPVSHQHLMRPGFFEDETSEASSALDTPERPSKRRRVQTHREAIGDESASFTDEVEVSEDEYSPGMDDKGLATLGESEESEEEVDGEDEDFVLDTPAPKRIRKSTAQSLKAKQDVEEEEGDLAGLDDGNESLYQSRLSSWVKRRSAARRKARAGAAEADTAMEDSTDMEEWYQPHPTRADARFDGGFRIPGDIYPSLFDYQKTGVQWLWELYSQQVGGIVGDEMGLGKTIQTISFLAGLHYSKKLTKPIVVVTPATVMKQWVNEFHRWWPPFRVSILHTSGSGMMDVKRERELEDDLERQPFSSNRRLTGPQKAAKKIVDRVVKEGHVLVTTYSGLQTYAGLLIPVDWEYAVLDEGHKIRNPNAQITIFCKELVTPNRIILSGTPMQNNLTELWSLFDFVFPMRLGTLVNFRNQFEFPIKQGGYANASNLQVETAIRCAETLKETISPYLLQRFKIDVAADLPKKTERVLFCKLTMLQRNAYEEFLGSEEMKSILAGRRQSLYGIDILRKICNHPDLVDHKRLSIKSDYNYGIGSKSGKMQVVKSLVDIWRRNGHKTLLFAQHRIMLDILEKFMKKMEGLRYVRMDGNTSIKDRQSLVDEFNRDPDLHVFLLTTKVGGLGVNLVGADRVIIYDPDWNPSTDVQARERAWRLGQKREVEIYRLMTAGTIEEKIYHRQIFKQFLTNKILKDPKQQRTFHFSDLHDLFTLGGEDESQTETSSLFRGSEVKLRSSDPKQTGAGMPTPPTEFESGKATTTATTTDDLANVKGIAHQEDFQTEEPTPTTLGAKPEEPSTAQADPLMTALFPRSHLHSTVSHDAVLASNTPYRSRKVAPDPHIIAAEAKRIAASAAVQLQRAGEVARTVTPGTVTWTGQFGTAGRPEERAQTRSPVPVPRTGVGMRGRGRGQAPMSGAALLALHNVSRSGTSTPVGNRSGGGEGGSRGGSEQPGGTDLLGMIQGFLKAHGGAAYSQMLVDHFNRFCRTEEKTAEFKELLREIATLERGARGGRGKWVLKEEWR
ncbi:hypothetical protein P152DRAFT_392239 [Eremomyces bilateralis CBS 781.70]|uniref:DNA repair and recombination protein RAD26 n=1 Tax=Eremomyces bilateralis CBS 781.70 TaxID=1392243 RepID=A0A6G1G9Q5_9PEZI|nr:uncharacterized protein P152DRAFT_392239 [Eremomyces bilateralis CBS 781.70]KAF1814817.1 hypothetical protein P152DRAFT_392239 [Eremomyces bilateralis CBS 781.70]